MSQRTLFAGAVAWTLLGAVVWLAPAPAAAQLPEPAGCNRTIHADVVALDQAFFWNRLGAVQPDGMIYALRRDVVSTGPTAELVAGHVELRKDKRPRPLVLRMGVGDCLHIKFQNLLDPVQGDEQPATRDASIHVVGLQPVETILDDGTNVGVNDAATVPPGGSIEYLLYGEREGEHVLHSAAAMTGGEGDGGSLNAGLFGAVIVEPKKSVWYRSQVTEADLRLAIPSSPGADLRPPKINYEAKFPLGHPRAGQPILRMLDANNNILYSDLRAIITGSNPNGPGASAGRFPPGTFPPNPVLPDREQAFREFVIIYHDEIIAVQAFPIFEDEVFNHTLHSGRDGFALNYGTGGIGAEVIANRVGVGPMLDCDECKYEEFFLTSWAVGDPAMVVDVPANAPCEPDDIVPGSTCVPTPGRKATRVIYPDDPSNVYPSYLGEHVKFRILHGGSAEHHIHHQHTHQWLHSPDSDESAYLDSQALGPGSSFTLEMVHNGSGNRNQAVGDSIFHCHFYPHFAQGMWALWRVHDVFEAGTPIGNDGKPVPGSRALPDGEILAGTPIPGLVPVPGRPEAPLPGAQVSIVNGQVQISGTGNPGYPFFIPGIAGRRPPHPPLDFFKDAAGIVHDGGLPRHIIADGDSFHVETRLDFTKILLEAKAFNLPEDGTLVEKQAMAFHEIRKHPTCYPDGTCDPALGGTTPVKFIANGLPRVGGAPYADPCIADDGTAIGDFRFYNAADIQMDVILNKVGWHFPQQRFLALWNDVKPTLDRLRPPEPLFFRANTNDCIEYRLTNLVPGIYELDDFQVRSPTDILGQHIHLVKFDVTASDGAANGWNYEDGTFSPDEVRERIEAINARGGLIYPNGQVILHPEDHPFFGPGPDNNGDGIPDWRGAQTTVQRWFADDVLNLAGKDRTLRTVFTHDHFGPSTHQQAGLYAGLVIEPRDSKWRHPETGVFFGTDPVDGGPTSWQADILTENPDDSYREFLLEFADFQLAYYEDNVGFPDPDKAINPPGRMEDVIDFLLKRPEKCPGGVDPPCPELISADDVGTFSVNYRNEPIAVRVQDPANNKQATGLAGDLAYAFSSNVTRANPRLNVQPAYPQPLTRDVLPRDPFTPLLRANTHDRVQIRILVGAHEEGHNFSVNGIKWLFEPSEVDSGFRNSQMMGISEHYEFVVPQTVKNPLGSRQDYLWAAGAATDDLWNGIWGILRVYKGAQADLLTLPNNPLGGKSVAAGEVARFDGVCPRTAIERPFEIVAVAGADVLPDGDLLYNPRKGTLGEGPIFDPAAILFVRKDDLGPSGKLKPGVPVEPLVLRANSGDCIKLSLENRLPVLANPFGWNTLPMLIDQFNNNQIAPSRHVGLHPQLLHYDVTRSDGNNVGVNPVETAGPGQTVTYQWWAGDVFVNDDGTVTDTPIEFGATNLIAADRIKQPSKGAIGALIIEPAGAEWETDYDAVGTPGGVPFGGRPSRAAATVKVSGPTQDQIFREFVVQFQNDLNLEFKAGVPIPNLAGEDDPEDSGAKAFNYRTEPMWFRLGYEPERPLELTRDEIFTKVLFNDTVGSMSGATPGQFLGDPETPIFNAGVGDEVRYRVLHPGGHPRNNVFTVHGHIWDREPYQDKSTVLGPSDFSMWTGAQMGHGPTNHFDVLLRNGAGGQFGVFGDYLYRTFTSFQFDGGMWGIFRVNP